MKAKLFLAAALAFVAFSFVLVWADGFSNAKQQEFDLQRQQDILSISEVVERYFEIAGHYPLVVQPQIEVVNVIIADEVPSGAPTSPSLMDLEKELQRVLGSNVMLPRDPENGSRYYQYATNGSRYFVAAYLYHSAAYAWEQEAHFNKVEISNRPSLRTSTHRPGYLRHVMQFGQDDADRQAKLYSALDEHAFERARELLSMGANPSPTCDFNTQCQMLAIFTIRGDLEVVQFLLENGADIDGFNSYDGTALIFALERQQPEIARFLIEAGADVNIPNAFGFSPFIGAPALGDVALLSLMLQNGAHLNQNYFGYVGDREPGWKGPLPLEIAVRYEQEEVVSFLLEAGADPELISATGETISELMRMSDAGISLLP